MITVNLDQLSQEQNREFNIIAEDIRADYNNIIVSLSEDHLDNIHWIVGSIASRNKYYSPLFIRCCQIAFVKKLLKQSNPVAKIVTKDRALATVLKKWCDDQNITGTVIHCSESAMTFVWRISRPLRQYLIAIYFLSLR